MSFDATSGGNAGSGPDLAVQFPSASNSSWSSNPQGRTRFDNKPDNLVVSPRGGLAICEDGAGAPQRIHGMTLDGRLFPFIRNNTVLNGERYDFRGDFRETEFRRHNAASPTQASGCFFNIRTPGSPSR